MDSESLDQIDQQSSWNIVIVGGGFAGLRCALELAAHNNIHITLIDKNNYQQFHPLLYQVAASILSPNNAAFALRDILRNHDNVDVQMDEVTSIDLAQRTVHTAAGNSFSGDFLVLATGSRVNFYGVPGADKFALPLYSLTDAEKLRSTILEAFEAADRNPGHPTAGSLNFVVVGGGPTGVEMAGTLSDMVQRVLQKEFRHVDPNRAQVSLIEQAPTVLGTFSPTSQTYAASALKQHGVQLRLGTAVKEVTPNEVLLSDGSRIVTRLVIWAAGVKAEAVPMQPAAQRQPNGRLEVQSDLSVTGFDDVYAIGDLANAAGSDGKPLPQLAAVAQQAGRHCARNILASISGEDVHPFVYSDRGILAMIGRNAAIAELGKQHHELVGPVAFAAWLGIHLALLTVVRAKLEAIVEWSWQYFTGEHPGQLIDR
jgi:NADH:ubiquinone reductase (H+-translocating)